MLAALAGLAMLAYAGRRPRALGDAPALPSGDTPTELVARERAALAPSGSTVFLVRPQDFVHPSKRLAAAEKGVRDGTTWAVVPESGWSPPKYFPTAHSARIALRAAGFRGPVGKGQSTRWSR